MTTFDDFKPREIVAHISLGDGVVTAVDDTHVHVTYYRAVGGKLPRGEYDRRWFELHPGYLFHRRILAPEDSSPPQSPNTKGE